MSTSAGPRPAPSARWARPVLVAVHLAVIAVAVVFTVLTRPGGPSVSSAFLPVTLGAVIGALQLRHSLATARGERPRGLMWTLLALTVLVYAPLPWFGLNWAVLQTAVIATVLMALPARTRVIGVALVLLAATAIALATKWGQPGGTGRLLYDVGGAVIFDGVVGVALYATARLVRVHDELTSARTELAELAVGGERLRVSRDLHDLLGQSLSAVSLKGDLAIRLLQNDPRAAQAEIESLTGVARDALRGVRAITIQEHTVSLRTETDGAAALLHAAGIRTRLVVDLPPLSAPVEQVLAWATREGVTNVLRHSHAMTCAITAGCDDRSYWLEILNDGVGPANKGTGTVTSADNGNTDGNGNSGGSGIAGLTERAHVRSGTVSARRGPDGTFRLRVEIPRRSDDPGVDR